MLSFSTPTCQSAEFVEVDAETGSTTWVNSSEPVEAHNATVPASKSISYAKLYQVPASKAVLHCEVPPTNQWRSSSPTPYFSSVK